MRVWQSNAVLLGVGLLLACSGTQFSLASSDSSHRRALVRPPQPPPAVAVVPLGPLSPLPLDQEPASPPQVVYHGGQLSITAQNSTLGDVLRAVHTQTGATVEVPGNPSDRVVGRFGPGPARDVIAALLNGSRYNYVLLGSATNPNALEHVILTASTGGVQGGPPPQSPPPQQAQEQPAVFGGETEQSDEMGTIDPGNRDEEQPEDQQAAENQAQTDDNNNGFQTPPPGGVRSPQQLLQELQQRQQNGANGNLFQPGVPQTPQTPQQQ